MDEKWFHRFNAKFHLSQSPAGIEGSCWVWFGAKGRGYGVVSVNGKLAVAHRAIYEQLVCPVRHGLQLDHLCRNGLCVNPLHLEQVTASENCRRGSHAKILKARGALITHCPKGHEYSGDNLYVKPNGRRECRICVRESGARYRERIKGAPAKGRKSSLGKYPRQQAVLNRRSYMHNT